MIFIGILFIIAVVIGFVIYGAKVDEDEKKRKEKEGSDTDKL
jgi:hypothetical protein